MALSYFNEFVGGVDQLWVTDGTALGTHLVASFGASAIQNLTTIGARVFFGLSDGTHGEELWTSDGTAAGTMMVKDIFPGSTSSFPAFLTSASGALYFEADDGSHGDELWKSNGTAAGTVMVADIFAGSGGSFPFLSDERRRRGLLRRQRRRAQHGAMEVGRDRRRNRDGQGHQSRLLRDL